MSTPIDEQTDAPIEAVARLLSESLRIALGDELVVGVITWPIPVGLIPAGRLPALVVSRESDREEGAVLEETSEVASIRIEYYAPVTPLDRVELRWPTLRRVWRHCLMTLRLGYDERVANGERLLAGAGFDVPAAVTGTARYLTAPIEGSVVPYLQATVSMRSSGTFDWDVTYDDLTQITSDADTAGNPDRGAFDSTEDLT